MNNSIYTLLEYKESPNVSIYFEIVAGEFLGLKCKLDDFQIFPHPTLENNISYNYHILEGEIPINKGEEFKSLTKDILKDIILKLHNKKVNIEST